MTEWTIILPVHGNGLEDRDITQAHATLRANIRKTGGWTERHAMGYWPSELDNVTNYEPVIEYVFTREDDALTLLQVQAIAAVAKAMAKQEGVLYSARKLDHFDIV